MKISCMKGKLMQGISNVSKAVSTKTTHPILSCIFIEAENGNIKLTANDMEIGIESYVEGTVIEEGKVAIEAKLLSDIVRSFRIVRYIWKQMKISRQLSNVRNHYLPLQENQERIFPVFRLLKNPNILQFHSLH